MKWTELITVISLLFYQALSFGQTSLENSLVLSDSATLRSLENRGFSVADLLAQKPIGITSNAALSDLPIFKPIVQDLHQEILDYQASHTSAGVGLGFSQRLFDPNYLTSPQLRFVLVGVINRMDKAYANPGSCGEIRFIYRLAYNIKWKNTPASSRLPMTMNLVFRLNSSQCDRTAQAWLKLDSNSKLQDWLQGPLSSEHFNRSQIKSIEVNLQLVRLAASARKDFGGHAEYVLKAYEWKNTGFLPAPLENQIDRQRLLSNPDLKSELKRWILNPENLQNIDAGTHLIPDKFLSKKAVSIAPGGIARSANRLFYSLFNAEELSGIDFTKLENLKSPAAVLRRLNDSTCTGCHQTRAIGGFHFTGKDPFGKYPGNSVFLPGSAHFMGDLPRRHAILQQISNREKVDYSRGFSARPQARRSQLLSNSGLYNGWGAHCSNSQDPSFKSWTCQPGLICKPMIDKDDGLKMGICLSETQQVGDPCEEGFMKTTGFGLDSFTRTSRKLIVTVPNAMCSPQSQMAGTKTGGFLFGNVRTLSCENLPLEASCGYLPASKPGFNSCIGKMPPTECVKKYSLAVGLRGCDEFNPCRDDYICAEGLDPKKGVCLPPYFLFQFRVDGHPSIQ